MTDQEAGTWIVQLQTMQVVVHISSCTEDGVFEVASPLFLRLHSVGVLAYHASYRRSLHNLFAAYLPPCKRRFYNQTPGHRRMHA
jgi:hypothetical protein